MKYNAMGGSPPPPYENRKIRLFVPLDPCLSLLHFNRSIMMEKKVSSSSSYNNTYSHAVSRSNELLSCAKTAWKLHHHQQLSPIRPSSSSSPHEPRAPKAPPPPPPIMPVLQLASTLYVPKSLVLLEEGLGLLRAMEYALKQLKVLVRRRGHTNDPTQEIASLVKQLEQDTKELMEFCEQILLKVRKSSSSRKQQQNKKHWEYVVQWFQQVADRYSVQLKECLELRGKILQEQAQQRKKVVASSSSSSSSQRNPSSNTQATTAAMKATPLFDSPLFTAPPPPKPQQHPNYAYNNNNNNNINNTTTANGATSAVSVSNPYARNTTSFSATTATTTRTPTSSSSSSYYATATTNGGYGGVGGGYGGGGSGDYYNNYNSTANGSTTGMRQRRGGGQYQQQQQQQQVEEEEEEEKIHHQIQQRQRQRQTQTRLDEARQAETMLGELGQLFGKMSTLISTQGEVLEKIEDDVEAAHADVIAGQEELTTLYQLKKGNRPLIIKTFAILNFLIIFMRAYKN